MNSTFYQVLHTVNYFNIKLTYVSEVKIKVSSEIAGWKLHKHHHSNTHQLESLLFFLKLQFFPIHSSQLPLTKFLLKLDS